MISYLACYTKDDGIWSCGHEHKTVREALDCVEPNGAGFIRARDEGVLRPLSGIELTDYYEALPTMPWSARNKKTQITT